MQKIKLITIALFIVLQAFGQNYTAQITQLKKKIASTGSPALKAQYYIQLATYYQRMDSIPQAIQAYEQALKLMPQTTNISALYQINSFLGILYVEQNNYQKALNHFQKALYYARRLKDEREISNALVNLANIHKQLGNYQDAIKYYEEALSIAFKQNNLYLLKKIYANIAICYKAIGDQDRYLKYYNLSVAIDRQIKEQIIKEKEQEAIRQAQLAKLREYQLRMEQLKRKQAQDSIKRIADSLEKERLKIANLEKEAKIKELELKRRKQIIQFLLIFLALVISAAAIILILLIRLKKAHEELKKLHEELKRKNRQIQESIQYASKIQRALLPSQAAIYSHFPAGAFIFYLPRDVVSGDFYWFHKQDKYFFLALVDCTGHSVPGAFMSLISNTLLSEVIKTKKILDPKEILYQLHYDLIELLHKRNPEEDVHDGMDIALCRFDPENDELVCASANQPIFIFYPDGEFKFIHGDIYSIGGFAERIKPKFNNYTLKLVDNMSIYMSSDGYFDQFNPNRKKFTRKRFIQLLKEIHTKPFSEQLEIIINTFNTWKGDFRQLDDILVIGVKYTKQGLLKPKNTNKND